ncbi:MAG: TetR/AcrR family transcriptional regulator [Thermoguttaceae bacterium]
MSDRKLDSQVRRRQIAEAALRLVADRGLGRLSVAAVARRVGLVPSGIYRHFKSKDEILLAVLDRIESRLMGNVQAASQEGSDPLERLRRLLMRHVRFIREGRAVPRIIFSDEFHGGHPERKSRLQKIFAGYLSRIGQFVRQGQQQALIRPELDPNTVAMMFLGMVVPAAIIWHVTDGGFDMTQHVGRAWQLFCRAISTEPR